MRVLPAGSPAGVTGTPEWWLTVTPFCFGVVGVASEPATGDETPAREVLLVKKLKIKSEVPQWNS